MRERELFLSALEIDDLDTREAHLKASCAGDLELLSRVESLLASHEGASRFLNTPAVEQMSDDAAAELNATILHGDGSTCDEAGSAGRAEANNRQEDEISLGYLQPSTQPDSLGRLGHYEILEVVGRGAFGTVLRAFDEKLQRVVAIKVLAPEMAATSPARKRFLREARTSAAVRHENVVAIYSVEDHPIPYLVMEYIPGKTLQQRLDELGPLDLLDVLRIGKQIADGLAAAHAQGLIHRDVKPGNILLEGGMEERVKITDFGLARTADDASMTQSGMIAGTPLYMAPEQAHGQKLDQRADLFSFGSVLYQMLSGRPPFRAPTTLAVLKRVVEDAPRPIQEIIPEAPDWICTLIGHLHAKNPDERYGSAKEVSDLLAHCLADLQAGRTPRIPSPRQTGDASIVHPALSKAPQGSRRVSKQTLVRAAMAAVLLLIAIVLSESTGVTRLSAFLTQSVLGMSQQPGEGPPPQSPRPEPMTWPADAPPLAMAPFDPDQAEQHQQAWADYLGVPVEKRLLLGQAQDGKDVMLSLVLIPPGEFMMGSSDEEIAKLRSQAKESGLRQRDFVWIDSEGPQRRVRITRPFYMSRTEITNAQFRSFAEAASFKTEAETSGKGSWVMKQGKMVMDPNVNWRSNVNKLAGTAPVIHINWHDANACCQWLTEQDTDLSFALPTEAEWEYACRAGTTTSWHFGDDESRLEDYAIVDLTWMRWVGSKKPNAFGLYDMHGNVWEWCRDSFYNYRGAETIDPVGPAGEKRIIRGGNFFVGNGYEWHNGNGRRSAVRYEAAADHRVLDKGFRVVAAISEDVIQAKLGNPQETPNETQAAELKWPADAPPLAIAPFDAEQAKVHQEAWAKYLGVPVEKEVVLGRDKDGRDVSLTMILIPPGEFMMGSTNEEQARNLSTAAGESDLWGVDMIRSEGPQHRVRITRPYYLAKHEVTQGQWLVVMSSNPSRFQVGPQHPVDRVSADEIQPFLTVLNDTTPEQGFAFSLPTEAQWEFACRAGTTAAYSFGDSDDSLGNFAWNVANSGRRTHPVGQLTPNGFGLHDMHGNVWEWCSDRFEQDYYLNSPTHDPYCVSGSSQVYRGGGCYARGPFCRSAHRRAFREPADRLDDLGFRLAAVLPDELISAKLSSIDGERVAKTPGSKQNSWPADAPPLAIAPFDAEQAKAHQEAWAKYLGVPVEKEILLGRNRLGQDVTLSLVLIPPGEFLMGTSQEEIDRLREQAPATGLKVEDVGRINLEGPQHRVQITRPFYLSRNEFTTDQFRSFVQAQPGEYKTEPEASGKGAWAPKVGVAERDPELNWKRAGNFPQGSDSPVVNVTWNDANDCCEWLSQQDTGLTFALPTEAQWEYACRAGTTTLWSTGDEQSSLEGYAVFKANWPKDIGDRLPNAFGLCDMHGNVWEWCQDAFYDYRDAASVDPLGAVGGEFRIIRGGSCFGGTGENWQENSGSRSAVRDVRRPNNPLLQVGLRVAAAIPDAVPAARMTGPASHHSYPSGEWIDVLPLIDPQLDKWDMRSTGKNEWRIEQGELVAVADEKPSKLLFPLDADSWRSFECELDVTRRAGELGFNLNIPAGAGDTPLGFDRRDNPGINLYGQQSGPTSLSDSRQIETSRRTILRIEVRQIAEGDRITVWNNDVQAGVWTGDRRRLVSINNEGYPHSRRLSLWIIGEGSEYIFHRIRLRTLDGETARSIRSVADAPSPVTDVPPLTDADADAIRIAELAAEQQAKAIVGLREAGWEITIDDSQPGKPVVCVGATLPDSPDADLDYQHLKHLPHLQEISFMFSGVQDSDLENIKDLKELRTLNFVFQGITEAGLVHLKGLKELRNLNLAEGPDVTDAGLKHLASLTNLEQLVVGTGDVPKITDAGLAHLKDLKNLEVLSIQASKVTDDGLKHLKGLQNLTRLQLHSESITRAAVEELKRDLPNCKVEISGR